MRVKSDLATHWTAQQIRVYSLGAYSIKPTVGGSTVSKLRIGQPSAQGATVFGRPLWGQTVWEPTVTKLLIGQPSDRGPTVWEPQLWGPTVGGPTITKLPVEQPGSQGPAV